MYTKNTIKKMEEILKKISKDTYLTSDTHYGHNNLFEKYEPSRKNIISSEKEKTLFNFENELIKRFNSKVLKNNISINLGDFCINKRNKEKNIFNIKSYNSKLNGNKILILGNHDTLEKEIYLKSGFDLIIDKAFIYLNDKLEIIDLNSRLSTCLILDINGKRIMLSHFPLFYNGDYRFDEKYKKNIEDLMDLYYKYKCDFNIHGHTHSKDDAIDEKLECVCVEKTNFYPITFSEIFIKRILNKK